MTDFDSNAPVLVGVGEASRASLGLDWPSPTQICAAAAQAALADSGAGESLAQHIDCLLAIRLFHDSGLPHEFGSPENFPESVALASGLDPAELIYADLGGQSPQKHLSELALRVHSGEIAAAMIVGGEAIGTVKRAKKAGHALAWAQAATRAYTDKRTPDPVLTMYNFRHGIISMPICYGLLENAYRARRGQSREAHAQAMAKLWAAFSPISLTRDHAQFPRAWTAEELLGEDHGNYRLNDPYRRWLVAQDAVDVGGAVILTSAGKARAWGIAEDRWVYFHAGADAIVPLLHQQRDLSVSPTTDYAIDHALDRAELTAAQLGPIDIYSCFPVAVSHAIDRLNDPDRPLGGYTLTGGLSFFGGTGNGYAMHSLVAMAQALRADGSKPGLVLANGGALTKQSAGIYARHPVAGGWSPERIAPVKRFAADDHAEADYFTSGAGIVRSYVTPWQQGAPGQATLWVEDAQGRMALAQTDLPAPDADVIGAKVTLTNDGKRNHATL